MAATDQTVPHSTSGTARRFGIAAAFVLCLGVAAYAIVGYTVLPFGALVHPDMYASFQAHKIGIGAHVFGAAVALLLGPFQFVSRLRARRPRLHRWIGRFYLGVGVLIGGSAGFYVAFHAFGGIVARLGFGSLALVWLYTGANAYAAIRRRDVTAHRRWMVRNFALTFGAVTLRIYLPLSAISGIAFETAYPAIAWLAWVPNLLVAQWWLTRRPVAIPVAA
jgi:uncharacterized membrane protein